MKNKMLFSKMISLLLIVIIICASLPSCANLEGIGEKTGQAANSNNETDTEPLPETTEPPHDHVYEDGACTECGASKGVAYTVNRETNTAEVTNAGGCKEETIKIAEHYKGYPVTHIASRAFIKCENVIDIIIPDTVLTIADETFAYTPAKTVTLSNGITEIPYRAFYQAPNLEKVIVGDNLTSIGMMAFYECESLTEINLPDTVTTIGNSAFSGCKALTSFTIPKRVTTLEGSTFSFCSSLLEVTFHENIKSIKETCFTYCEKLTKLNSFPSNPDYVSNMAFSSTNLPRNEYKNCLYIGNESNPYVVLESCIDKKRTKVEIHPDTRIIADRAFHSSSLTEVTIPDKVATIGHSAFSGSFKLSTITMSDSVTFIGEKAFSQCISLKDVRLSDSLTELLSHTFNGCESLVEITIPKSVVTIGEQMFDGCKSLTTIHIPTSVKNIKFTIYDAPISEIRYEGTKEEWMKIQYILEQHGGFTVYCSDATINY